MIGSQNSSMSSVPVYMSVLNVDVYVPFVLYISDVVYMIPVFMNSSIGIIMNCATMSVIVMRIIAHPPSPVSVMSASVGEIVCRNLFVSLIISNDSVPPIPMSTRNGMIMSK